MFFCCVGFVMVLLRLHIIIYRSQVLGTELSISRFGWWILFSTYREHENIHTFIRNSSAIPVRVLESLKTTFRHKNIRISCSTNNLPFFFRMYT